MISATRPGLLIGLAATLVLAACTEEFQSLSTSLSSEGSTSSSTAASGSPAGDDAPAETLTRHDAALRFLTAYIRRDPGMARRYATQKAIGRLDWNRPHRDDIPYYDDKMILHFRDGWARVYFQKIGGSYKVSDFDVHRD